MTKNKLFLLLALLLTAATGAWAANTVKWTLQNQLPTLEGKTTATIDGVTITTPSAITVSSGRPTFNVATFSVTEGNITKIVLKSISGVTDYPTGWTISDYTDATWTGSAKSVSCGYSGGVYSIEFTIEKVYTVTMAKGTVDATNWTINPAEAAEGTEVTLQYNGRLKVKGVKATSDEQEAEAPATALDNTTTAWTAGTFAVPAGGLTYSAAITVSGDVTLTLTEGTTLTLNKGISLASGATLTVEGTGTMNVNGTNNSTASTVAGSTGTLILTSGTLTATGGNGGNIDYGAEDSHGGNGGDAINGSVTVSGGTLTARGGNGGSVDDWCDNCSGGKGGDAISGTLTINGGSTSVNDGSNGSIGEGCDNCSAGAGGKAVAGTVTDNR